LKSGSKMFAMAPASRRGVMILWACRKVRS
jgi:hypothetical protein